MEDAREGMDTVGDEQPDQVNQGTGAGAAKLAESSDLAADI